MKCKARSRQSTEFSAFRRKGASMKLYGLKNCDTCRKALKALPQAQLVDVRTDGVGADVLARALAQFGAALVNTRSTTWRALDAGARAQPPLALLQAHPSLLKRPLIETADGTLYLGWGKAEQAALA
jgi:arsenate reductase